MDWEEWCDSVDRRSHPCVALAAESLAFVKFQALPGVFPQAKPATMQPQGRSIYPVTVASLHL